MDQKLLNELKEILTGDVATDEKSIAKYSHDASIFEIEPNVVVFPKSSKDIQNLIKFTTKYKATHSTLSLTARAAGTCMSGGSLNTSIIVNFNKYFNHKPTVKGYIATTEPGVYYRDFEKETLRHGLIFPSYPSSREICAMGGIVNNNAGGEKSLQYGKTEDYVHSLNMVLADGQEYKIKPLSNQELHAKMKQDNFEGHIYKEAYKLITTNYELLTHAKPDVSKNSAGYFLWNVWDPEKKIFDLTKLFIGAQGTLGLMTEAKLKLVPTKKHTEMMIILMHDFTNLTNIINTILPLKPESFEAYDDKTLKLALRFFPEFAKKLGTRSIFSTALKFLPELILYKEKRLPKLIMQIEFADDHLENLNKKIEELTEKLKKFHPDTKVAIDEEEKKYWLIRRDSFGLLRSHIKNMYSSPFIDDIIIKPEHLPEFLPKFNAILDRYPSIIGTFAGHIGNGNFHVIPLVKLTDLKEQHLIPKICDEVFELVAMYKGSSSGEHNDGWIRTPYLHYQFDAKIIKLFEETKKIFDPQNIFNPHKKVDGDLDFAMKHIRKTW